jgi:peptidoglycan/xylan/chitin deacetylase (PgdA/CDA1 family)
MEPMAGGHPEESGTGAAAAGAPARLATALLAAERAGLDTRRNQFDRLAGRIGMSTRMHRHRGGVATILGYHSIGDPLVVGGDPRMVLSPADFTAQMEFLASKRRVVPLDSLLATLAAGHAPERGTVVLTIDDGYRDTLTTALPVFERLGLHATVYVSGAFIGDGGVMPIDDLYWSLTQRRHDELPEGIVDASLRTLTPANELRAFNALGAHTLDLSPDDRDAELAAIRQALDPADPPPSRMMTWDEVATLGASPHITLAVHPHRHTDLRAYPDMLDDDLCMTRDAVETATGTAPVDISYAYNRQGPRAAARVAELGFRSALGAGASRVVAAGTSPFALMRIDAPRDLDLLRAWTL